MLRALFRFFHSNVWGNKIGRISRTKAKIKNPTIFFSNLVTSYVYDSRVKSSLEMLPTVLNIILYYLNTFFFSTLCVTSYLVCNYEYISVLQHIHRGYTIS